MAFGIKEKKGKPHPLPVSAWRPSSIPLHDGLVGWPAPLLQAQHTVSPSKQTDPRSHNNTRLLFFPFVTLTARARASVAHPLLQPWVVLEQDTGPTPPILDFLGLHANQTLLSPWPFSFVLCCMKSRPSPTTLGLNIAEFKLAATTVQAPAFPQGHRELFAELRLAPADMPSTSFRSLSCFVLH